MLPDMLTQEQARSALEASLAKTDDVYINSDMDAPSYLAGLAEDIRAHLCQPFMVTARVTDPGFPWLGIGESISGICIAHNSGNWLFYQPPENRFLCFWGPNKDQLGAPGIFGSPLYCWSA